MRAGPARAGRPDRVIKAAASAAALICGRGPTRWASRPLEPDSSKVTAVTGTSAEPATTGL